MAPIRCAAARWHQGATGKGGNSVLLGDTSPFLESSEESVIALERVCIAKNRKRFTGSSTRVHLGQISRTIPFGNHSATSTLHVVLGQQWNLPQLIERVKLGVWGSPFAVADESAMDGMRTRVLARFAGRWPRALATKSDTLWRSLDFQELSALGKDDHIDFGVHTLSHPALPLLSYPEQVSEIRNNFQLLRSRLPRVQQVVAYPYGLYDDTTVRAAIDAGMVAGLTMEGRATADQPDTMRAPRIGGADVRTPHSLARRLNRALRPALILRNRGRHPRMPDEHPPMRPGLPNVTPAARLR